MSTPTIRRRHRTWIWFAGYTVLLAGIAVVSALGKQWSVAMTTVAITVVFAVITRWLWRRR